MAKLERRLQGDFTELLTRLSNGLLQGSVSASLEDESYFCSGESRCAVRVFERYSFSGGNRVSLTLTLYQAEERGPIFLSAITAGGSQALFMKMNTFGEQAFLDKLEELL